VTASGEIKLASCKEGTLRKPDATTTQFLDEAHWLAPELKQDSSEVSDKSDVYAIGMLAVALTLDDRILLNSPHNRSSRSIRSSGSLLV